MKHKGFAAPVALGFALLMALLAATALHDATLARALATARLGHQRAFAAGEFGIAQAAAELDRGDPPIPAPRSITLPGNFADNVETQVSEVIVSALPAGYSVGRVVQRHFEVRSTGASTRSARVVQVQGYHRLELAESGPGQP